MNKGKWAIIKDGPEFGNPQKSFDIVWEDATGYVFFAECPNVQFARVVVKLLNSHDVSPKNPRRKNVNLL